MKFMKEISLEGSFHEMGKQYGAELKQLIKMMIFEFRLIAVAGEKEGRDFFRPKPAHLFSSLFQVNKYKESYRQVATEFEENIQRYYPETLDFVKGMAEASGTDYKDILFCNCLLEYSLKCSAFGAAGSSTKDNRPILGMNADEGKATQKYYRLVHVKPDKGFAYSAVYIDGTIFPVFGMNETGLSLASIALFLDNSAVDKIRKPMLMKLSVLHRCRNVEEAERLFAEIPPSGMGSAIYVADEKRFLVCEENAVEKAVKVYDNGTHHTANFPQSAELRKFVKIDALDDISFFFARDRQRRIGSILEKNNGKLDEDIFYSILSDHGSEEDGTLNRCVCVHPENTKGIKTCSSIILSPGTKTMKVYYGNPCRNDYKIIRF